MAKSIAVNLKIISMTEKRNSDISGLLGDVSKNDGVGDVELTKKERREMFRSDPFDNWEIDSIASELTRLGANKVNVVKDQLGEVNILTGYCPDSVVVEVYRGMLAESVDVILRTKLDSFDDGEEKIQKLRRMIVRRWILEQRGYHLRTDKGYVNDSKPGFNEDRDYRMAYTKPLDTRIRERVSAEVKNIMTALFKDLDKIAAEAKDPEEDMW